MPLPRRLRVVTPFAPDGGATRPLLPPVPDHMPPPGWAEWLNRIARTLNAAIFGNINVIADAVLAADADNTIVLDTRIGVFSAVIATPLSANAAAAMTGMWFEAGAGQVTIHHAAASTTDRYLRLVIFG